jgi:hypothetical protein
MILTARSTASRSSSVSFGAAYKRREKAAGREQQAAGKVMREEAEITERRGEERIRQRILTGTTLHLDRLAGLSERLSQGDQLKGGLGIPGPRACFAW